MPKTGPNDWDAFLGSAQWMWEGVHALHGASPPVPMPRTLLAGIALECALKAFLSRAGKTADEIIRMGHDLKRLWRTASRQGLAIPATPPQWVKGLHAVYASPYLLRYPMDKHGLTAPNANLLDREVGQVITDVRSALAR